ncbi:hypothetical protein V5O48_013654 [Marasmius crinis-equi]|uniref:Uncharacterized protein n=1 Tax=Marasmius crinis-equi TaxID=585013 RepID=A0ABR3EZH8_9AGAR
MPLFRVTDLALAPNNSFFAGLGCTCAQLGISIVLNSVAGAMDMTCASSFFPPIITRSTHLAALADYARKLRFPASYPSLHSRRKYLNIQRGAYLLAALGFITNPWEYLNSASIFLTVLSGFGIFRLMLADYHLIRRYKLKMKDLYVGDSGSIYWYWHGIHWRAVLGWILGMFPTLPGLIMTVRNPDADNGWVRLFRLTFFVGLAISFVSYTVICKISPPPGLGVGESRHDDSIVFGVEDDVGGKSLSETDVRTDAAEKEKA